MRIRKRKVGFPLSSVSPVPLSDLHLPLPVVQLQLHTNNHHHLHLNHSQEEEEDDTAAYFDPPSSNSDHQPIGAEATATFKDEIIHKDNRPTDEEGGGDRSNDTRESLLGAKTNQAFVILQTPTTSQQGRWCEGEKTFPLKKRRGNFETRSENDSKKMKTKMNKKCLTNMGSSSSNNNNQEFRDDNNKESKECFVDGGSSASTSTSGKKRGRGGALMEGSRCSRVNGRGWRCCQQTLVGYSLCEHHLGKGRLRSMTSVRSRSMATAAAAAPKTTKAAAMSSHQTTLSSSSLISSSDDHKRQLVNHVAPADYDDNKLDDSEGGKDYEKKPLMMISKRKMTLGVVKARSISSLLGQADSEINAVEENNK